MLKHKKKINFASIIFYSILLSAVLIFSYSLFFDSPTNVVDDLGDLFVSRNFLEVVNTFETNSELVAEEFADGMDLTSFNNILLQKDNYIESSKKYSKIEYNFDKSLHYSEIEDYLLKLNNSDIVKLELIGSSVDNRNIYSIEIGKGTDTLLIDANIHAAEAANTIMLLKYMIEIVNKYESNDEEIVNILNNSKLVILPCINPDGYEVFNFGVESLNNKNLWMYKNKDTLDVDNIKSNANGVDLNRNLPTQISGMYFTTETLNKNVSLERTTNRYTYFGGEYVGSEPETKALMYFMLKHYKNTFAYIDMHCQGRVIYQGKPNLSDEFNTASYNLANYFKGYNSYKVHSIKSEEVGKGNDGSATDFMAELANGFKFSSVTGRLSSSEYLGGAVQKYKYGVITLETTRDYARDVSVYEYEYNNYKYYEIFTTLLKNRSY